MKNIRLDRWFLAGIALGLGWYLLAVFLRLSWNAWPILAITLLVVVLMALLFRKSNNKK